LQATVPNVLNAHLEEVRDGYVHLTDSIDTIRENILNASYVKEKSDAIIQRIKTYQDKYWEQLKSVDDVDDIRRIREAMLTEIKDILLEFNHINEYDGYQIIADIWEQTLTEDTEVIALSDFYTEGRKRTPRMVTKGSDQNKREEQDGWVGNLVPNDLIKHKLFNNELTEIENKKKQINNQINQIKKKKTKLQEVEAELTEIIEAAKEEESDEEVVLNEALNEREDAFLIGSVRSELKEVEEDSTDYKLLT